MQEWEGHEAGGGEAKFNRYIRRKQHELIRSASSFKLQRQLHFWPNSKSFRPSEPQIVVPQQQQLFRQLPVLPIASAPPQSGSSGQQRSIRQHPGITTQTSKIACTLFRKQSLNR